MAKTDLKLTSTNGYGDDITTTISYVNPDAGKNDILDFTQALNALTTNTYKETQKIQTVNVDLEDVPSTPTISASITTLSAANFIDSGGFKKSPTPVNLTYNGDGDLTISKSAIQANLRFEQIAGITNGVTITPYYSPSTAPTFPITFKLGFSATNNYKACSVDITITA